MKTKTLIVCMLFISIIQLEVNASSLVEITHPKAQTAPSDTSKDFNIFRDAAMLANCVNVKKINTKYGISHSCLSSGLVNTMGTDGSSSSSEKSKLGLSGIEVTSMADGLAKFLVGRVKKELSIAFFQEFKKQINDSKVVDLKILFTETQTELNFIDEKIYDFKPYLNGIRAAAIADFKTIPNNLPRLLNTNTMFYNEFKDNANALYGFEISFGILKELNQKRNLGLALEKLDVNTTQKVDPSLKDAFELLRLFSFGLKGTNDKSYYLTKEEANELLKNTDLLKCYTDLLQAYAKLDAEKQSVKIPISKGAQELIKTYFEKGDDYTVLLKDLLTAVSGFREMENADEEEKIISYFQSANQFLESTKTIGKILSKDSTAFSGAIDKSQNMVNLLKAVYTKNYTSALGSVTLLFRDAKNCNSKKLIKTLTTYGTFIAQVSQAKDSDEISMLLEQFAAPVGSYRDKSTQRITVALDSYVGVGYAEGNPTDMKHEKDFWVNTPVGVSFSVPIGKASFTIMPTLLDIGPLVSYRFLNSAGEVSKIYLKEIFSPGVFASVGLGKKIPLFINAGWQKAASLTGVNTTGNSYNLKPYELLSISAAVNIPIFNIYNK